MNLPKPCPGSCKGFTDYRLRCPKGYCSNYKPLPKKAPPPAERLDKNVKSWSEEHFIIFEEVEVLAAKNDEASYEKFTDLLDKMEDDPSLQLKMIGRWLFYGAKYDQFLTDSLGYIAEKI